MGTPNTWIMLCKGVNLMDGQGEYDTLYFADNETRFNYFLGKAITVNPNASGANQKRFTEQMYTRVDNNHVRVQAPMSALIGVDYMVLCNFDTNNEKKYYYCFVDNVSYLNDLVTLIEFHEDVFQTWIGDVSFSRSFIERGHLDMDDSLWRDEYRISDIVEDGDMLTDHNSWIVPANFGELCLVLVSPYMLKLNESLTPGATDYVTRESNSEHMTTGQNCGTIDSMYYHVAPRLLVNNTYDYTLMTRLMNIARYATDGDVVNMYLTRLFVCGEDVQEYYENGGTAITVIKPPASTAVGGTYNTADYPESIHVISQTFAFNTQSDLNSRNFFRGYVPKNKKLYTAPYVNIRIRDAYGQFADFNPIDLFVPDGQGGDVKNLKMTFHGVLGMQPALNAYFSVDGQEVNSSTRFTIPCTSRVLYTNDKFASWWNVNNDGIMISALGNLAVEGTKAVIKGGLPLALSGMGAANKAVNFAAEVATIKQQPVSIRGSQDKELTAIAEGFDAFELETQSISYATAVAIDDAFERYGYALKALSEPRYALTGFHPVWRYTKTAGVGLTGNIPKYARDRICAIYDNGCRIWAPSHYLDYSQVNHAS